MSKERVERFYRALKTVGLLSKPFYAEEIMTRWKDVSTVERKTAASEALKVYLTKPYVHHLLVLDKKRPVGVVHFEKLAKEEQGPMVNFMFSGKFDARAFFDQKIEAFMQPIHTVKQQDSLFKVVNTMKATGSDAVAVIDDKGDPIGLITGSDIRTKL